jgi:hypothetical protein
MNLQNSDRTALSAVRVLDTPVEVNTGKSVMFDPLCADHRNAFRIMILAGKQTDIRFDLEGFTSVPAMMLYKMAVFGAGALDTVSRDTRANLEKRVHLHVVPSYRRT